ncbi:MFS transporter [Nocardia sp. ET3-3]|uniref:MFS transporter n=1 Tax=Nocardia terrae TaxID=2675851 RepID=A0A7K1USC2_9NOCA|nr:MFS transporter [Nocardia terrae]MVU77234.1 MFS transporter [Nocardia terrae]
MNADQPAIPTIAPASASSVRAVVGLLVCVELVSGFVQGGTVLLTPAVRDMIHLSTAQIQWVVAVQFMATAVSVPVLGRLGDLYGHRRILRIALACIAIGATLVALAHTLPVLLIGRVLGGTTAALLPLEIALCRDRLNHKENRRAVALLAAALALGSLLGTLLTGPIYHFMGDVRYVLWVFVALVAACVLISWTAVPESGKRSTDAMDWPGAVLLGGALVIFLAAVSKGRSLGWGSPLIPAAVLVALALFGVWVRVERRRPDPLIDIRAVANRAVAPHLVSAFIFGVSLLAAPIVSIAYLDSAPEKTGYGFHLEAWQLSIWAGIPHVLAFATSTIAATVAGRIGMRRMLCLAFVLIAIGYGGLMVAHASLPLFGLAYAIAGAGAGLALAGLPTVIVESSATDRSAGTVAVYNNVYTIGGSVASAGFSALLGALVLPHTALPSVTAYLAVWGLCAAGAVIAAVLTLTAPAER